MKYTLRQLNRTGLDAFLSQPLAKEFPVAVDLSTEDIASCRDLASLLAQEQEGGKAFLLLDAPSVTEASAWWTARRRVMYEDAEYVVLDDGSKVADDTYRGVSVNLLDKKLYKLTWCLEPELTTPFSDPEFARLMLDKVPVCDWNHPIGAELLPETL